MALPGPLQDFVKAVEKINSFKLLDSQESILVKANAKKFAHIFMDYLSFADDIYENPHGTISIEWDNEFKEIISIEIGKETMSFFVKLNDAPLATGENLPIRPSLITTMKMHFVRLSLTSHK